MWILKIFSLWLSSLMFFMGTMVILAWTSVFFKGSGIHLPLFLSLLCPIGFISAAWIIIYGQEKS
jgi:hypothetical protein